VLLGHAKVGGETGGLEVVGREVELATCRGILDRIAAGESCVLVVGGDAGIGKTTLHRAVVEDALARSYRVLSGRPAEAEALLSYVTLADLMTGVVEDVLPRLPNVQARAIEIALLRAEPEGSLQQRAVAAAFLSTLTVLEEEGPVLVAVDDIQWLDPPSAHVLAYAFRRLDAQRVGFVLSLRGLSGRGESRDALSRSLPQHRTHRLELGPLSVGALQRILRTQLGQVLPRPLLLRVVATSGGNALYALEIARALVDVGDRLSPGDVLPMPESVFQIVAEHLGVLDRRARRALLAASAMVRPTLPDVERVLGSSGDALASLEEAENEGIITLDGERVEFAHPLFASSLYASAGVATRRHLHRQLADVATDLEERAWHLARSATGPDERAASVLEQGARAARTRGAPDAAAELAELSRRLTPVTSRLDAVRRAMDAANCRFEAGDTARARALLEEVVEALPPGRERAEALLRLACVRHYEQDRSEAAALLDQGLQEAGDSPALLGWIHAVLARVHAWTHDVDRGLEHAREALRLAENGTDSALLFLALTAVAMSEVFTGRGLRRGLLERALALDEPEAFLSPVVVAWHPSINFASLLIYVEELDTARTRLEAMLQRATEGGDEGSIPELRFWLGELECRAGNLELAKQHAREGYEAALEVGQKLMVAQLCSTWALAHGFLGEAEEAAAAAEEGLGIATMLESAPPTIRNLAALGALELSMGDTERASQHLGSALEVARSTGYREPGQFLFLGNLIESLIATGRHEEASALTDELEEQGRRLGRAWALVVTARGRALLAAAEGRVEAAEAAIGEACVHQARLPMPLEQGRTLLVRGQIERRLKQRKAARETLADALRVFESLGATIWAERARAESARLGGKGPRSAVLTPTELRVAELVAAGYSNKEVASTLFVTVKAIEKSLSSVYAKLGIESRAQLIRRAASGDGLASAAPSAKE
jgi:ATP/maltotriose-dependent transcriptional regulator MalT